MLLATSLVFAIFVLNRQVSGLSDFDIALGISNFTCPDGRPLELSRVCDGIGDCGAHDFTDESNVTCAGLGTTCQSFQQKCPYNNICISPADRCDGYNDCGDNSDESPEFCENRQCEPLHVKCPTSSRCIPEHWQCDGDEDCPSGWDEGDQCKDGQCVMGYVFRCEDGKCLNRAFVCDGEEDCNDGSDEHASLNCSTRVCRSDEFKCHLGTGAPNGSGKGYTCIPKHWKCDGYVHCNLGEDESEETCGRPRAPCGFREFTCDNSQCIQEKWVCDGDPDCNDSSDEKSTLCDSRKGD